MHKCDQALKKKTPKAPGNNQTIKTTRKLENKSSGGSTMDAQVLPAGHVVEHWVAGLGCSCLVEDVEGL